MQRPTHDASPNHSVSSHPPIAFNVSSDSEIEPEDDNRMTLNRFAFQNPSRTQSKASLSRTSSIATANKPVVDVMPKMKPSRNAGQHRFMADFSNAELARLVKCVCCGIGWTTRKGVAQKMVHVQSCARRNAFTDDTVKILIRQEVDKALAESQVAKMKDKALDPENVLPEAPRTYLDDVLREVEPKRRGRHPEIKTIKNGLETREGILDRARVILRNHALPNAQEEGSHQSQELRSSRLASQPRQDVGSWSEFPATQAFGESALRHKRAPDVISRGAVQKQPMFDTEAISLEEAGIPPSTQNFAPSKLAGLHPTTSNSVFNMQYDVESSSSPPSPRLVRMLLTSARRARLITCRHPLRLLSILSAQAQETHLSILPRRGAA